MCSGNLQSIRTEEINCVRATTFLSTDHMMQDTKRNTNDVHFVRNELIHPVGREGFTDIDKLSQNPPGVRCEEHRAAHTACLHHMSSDLCAQQKHK